MTDLPADGPHPYKFPKEHTVSVFIGRTANGATFDEILKSYSNLQGEDMQRPVE